MTRNWRKVTPSVCVDTRSWSTKGIRSVRIKHEIDPRRMLAASWIIPSLSSRILDIRTPSRFGDHSRMLLMNDKECFHRASSCPESCVVSFITATFTVIINVRCNVRRNSTTGRRNEPATSAADLGMERPTLSTNLSEHSEAAKPACHHPR